MLNVSNTVGAASLLFLFQSANVPPAHSDERHVVLTNNTHEPIIEIYVSDDRTDNWQKDHLGSEFLLPGNSVSVEVVAYPAVPGSLTFSKGRSELACG